MSSSKNLNRLAYSIKESGFLDFGLEEDYRHVQAYVEGALQELYKALEVEDALTLDGFQELVRLTEEIKKYLDDFDSVKVIPLR